MRKITEFPKLVIEEAKNLKKLASGEEKSRLNFKELDPEFPTACIYGQMTKNCHSERAVELIRECASRVYYRNIGNTLLVGDTSKLNGSPKKIGRSLYWSPIEVFISRANTTEKGKKMNEKLIS